MSTDPMQKFGKDSMDIGNDDVRCVGPRMRKPLPPNSPTIPRSRLKNLAAALEKD